MSWFWFSFGENNKDARILRGQKKYFCPHSSHVSKILDPFTWNSPQGYFPSLSTFSLIYLPYIHMRVLFTLFIFLAEHEVYACPSSRQSFSPRHEMTIQGCRSFTLLIKLASSSLLDLFIFNSKWGNFQINFSSFNFL